MKNCILFTLTIAVIAAFLPSAAYCGELKVLDTITDQYLTGAQLWAPVLQTHARYLFYALATIGLVFTFIYGAVRGYSLSDFFSEFLRFAIVTGFFLWLLQNGPVIGRRIFRSMGQIGVEAASAGGGLGYSYATDLTPSGIVDLSYDVVMIAILSFEDSDWGIWLVTVALALMLAILFAYIAVQMMLLQISGYILCYAGLWYLGLGGIAYTRDIVINYIKTLLGIGIQIMCYFLLVGMGFSNIRNMLKPSDGVTEPIYTADGIVDAATNTIMGLVIAVVYSIILLELVKKVPPLVAGVITGAGTGSIASAGGAYGALLGAAGVAAGAAGAAVGMAGGMASIAGGVASGVAGQGMALSAAFQQAKSHMMDSGGGALGGGLSGGLAGVMNKGLALAGDTMANYAKGAASAIKEGIQNKASGMKESIQNTTTGGKIADKIQQNSSAEKTEKALKGIEQQGSSKQEGNGQGSAEADGGGKGGSSSDPFEGGGAISGGGEGSSGSGSAADGNDGGENTGGSGSSTDSSGSNGGGESSGADAGGETAGGNEGTEGNSNVPFDGGGSDGGKDGDSGSGGYVDNETGEVVSKEVAAAEQKALGDLAQIKILGDNYERVALRDALMEMAKKKP